LGTPLSIGRAVVALIYNVTSAAKMEERQGWIMGATGVSKKDFLDDQFMRRFAQGILQAKVRIG
jgi:hypothetical protein